MGISGTTTSFNNRTVDVEFLQTIEVLQPQQVTLSIQTTIPKIVTGIEKLAQRFAIHFLSTQDSKYDTNLGTSILQDIARGLIQSNSQLNDRFAFIASKVVTDMNVETDETTPDDEVIRGAELLDYNVDLATGKVYMQIYLRTIAGDEVIFVIPTTAVRT